MAAQSRPAARAPRIGVRPPSAGAAPGFMLAELLVAVALAAVLLTMGVPGYRAWIADEQLMNHARLLAASMQFARSEAIKRGHRVNLCKSADGLQCADAGRWDQGFILHGDFDRTGEVDGPDTILRFEPAPKDILVSANRPLQDYVSYTSFGHARMLSGALQMGTFTVCKPGRRAVEVVLVASGRVRIDRTKAICP
jgi:type IV fimbrial biogenesis protein FimT